MGKRSIDEALAHFNTVPWTKAWIEDPAYETPKWANQTEGGAGSNNGFYMDTLNSKETIPHMLVLVKKELAAPNSSSEEDGTPQLRRKPSVQDHPADAVFLLKLGDGGLDGHSGLMHGGMCCALLDHSAGYTVVARQQKSANRSAALPLYTVHMSTSFFGPVQTEGREIILKSWLISQTSAKWVTRAQIVNKEGQVLAQGDAVWIVAKSKM